MDHDKTWEMTVTGFEYDDLSNLTAVKVGITDRRRMYQPVCVIPLKDVQTEVPSLGEEVIVAYDHAEYCYCPIGFSFGKPNVTGNAILTNPRIVNTVENIKRAEKEAKRLEKNAKRRAARAAKKVQHGQV